MTTAESEGEERPACCAELRPNEKQLALEAGDAEQTEARPARLITRTASADRLQSRWSRSAGASLCSGVARRGLLPLTKAQNKQGHRRRQEEAARDQPANVEPLRPLRRVKDGFGISGARLW